MVQLGLVGLGTLGRAIAGRLAEQGLDLVVWNRTPEKAHGLAASVAASPAALISSVPIVVLSLFDSAAVDQVLFGEGGVFAGDAEGKILVDTTTNSADAADRFHEQVHARGAYYVEAPVIGSVPQVAQGRLTALVSGQEDAWDEVRPFLEQIAANTIYLGKPGLATRLKLAANLVLATWMTGLAEALVLAERSGLPRELVLDVLAQGPARSTLLDVKRDNLARAEFPAAFSAAAMHKDLRAVQRLAHDTQAPLFVGSLVRELYGAVLAHRDGDRDFSAIYRMLSNLGTSQL
ncbi:MAG: NAD(P)-dependent oxidoreductase [Acidobacteria bacterium]|nr:NAD(P)-dependent oxidoreductase [Acidobacteriota bacterium]